MREQFHHPDSLRDSSQGDIAVMSVFKRLGGTIPPGSVSLAVDCGDAGMHGGGRTLSDG